MSKRNVISKRNGMLTLLVGGLAWGAGAALATDYFEHYEGIGYPEDQGWVRTADPGVQRSLENGWLVVEAEQDPSVAPSFRYAKMGYDHLRALVDEGAGPNRSAFLSGFFTLVSAWVVETPSTAIQVTPLSVLNSQLPLRVSSLVIAMPRGSLFQSVIRSPPPLSSSSVTDVPLVTSSSLIGFRCSEVEAARMGAKL